MLKIIFVSYNYCIYTRLIARFYNYNNNNNNNNNNKYAVSTAPAAGGGLLQLQLRHPST